MVRTLIEARSPSKQGVQRGTAPLPGVWGVPQNFCLLPPSSQEGGKGDGTHSY